MTRTMFLVIWIVIAGGLLTFMAVAWRGRKRRDAALALPELGLAGDVAAEFAHVSYVSTTPKGAPLERVAIPGLTFKGWADVTVRRDGVEIAVQGERPVEIASAQLRGTDAAAGRIGKIVERDGLSLLQWQSQAAGARELESSFRFSSPTEQRRFAAAVSEISQNTSQTNHSSQEDA
ncbi:hypothetical protein [Leucobacter sp. G161]|uniref:PH-like domain-containing protein n=1 Tax=Leucobacter sp. G161 TaxID=663704 RepID=UPI00073C88BD|nr:hypothetical protein [Leucobacter sp. G161]KUF07031.1 hypothetical protein AUL38_01625 [Leucobacter sp. G161]